MFINKVFNYTMSASKLHSLDTMYRKAFRSPRKHLTISLSDGELVTLPCNLFIDANACPKFHSITRILTTYCAERSWTICSISHVREFPSYSFHYWIQHYHTKAMSFNLIHSDITSRSNLLPLTFPSIYIYKTL